MQLDLNIDVSLNDRISMIFKIYGKPSKNSFWQWQHVLPLGEICGEKKVCSTSNQDIQFWEKLNIFLDRWFFFRQFTIFNHFKNAKGVDKAIFFLPCFWTFVPKYFFCKPLYNRNAVYKNPQKCLIWIFTPKIVSDINFCRQNSIFKNWKWDIL